MNGKAPLYQGDVKPMEFTIAVTVGGIGSAVLSGLRVNPLISVGFALVVMGVLAVLRWRIASEFKDFESLEAFGEDLYLLGYVPPPANGILEGVLAVGGALLAVWATHLQRSLKDLRNGNSGGAQTPSPPALPPVPPAPKMS